MSNILGIVKHVYEHLADIKQVAF